MKDINIKFISQKDQRYDNIQEIGDYWETDNSIEIRITEFENPCYSYACMIHELVEKIRNNQAGIKDADVDQFDLDNPDLEDPGMSPLAPYHATHVEADVFERLYIIFSGNDWPGYEQAIDKLFEKPQYAKDSPSSLIKK